MITYLLQDKNIVEEIPKQNRCADIWTLINPETNEVHTPNKEEPKVWVHTDY
jgi:hypothetical protein